VTDYKKNLFLKHHNNKSNYETTWHKTFTRFVYLFEFFRKLLTCHHNKKMSFLYFNSERMLLNLKENDTLHDTVAGNLPKK
jgi:hypothetical protein